MNSRAPRFPYEGLLSFRPVGQLDWVQGMTINVSSSGMLFRSSRCADVEEIVQITYVLPRQIPGKIGEVLSCRGQIVRTVRPDASDCYAHMGVKILEPEPIKS